MINPLFEKFTIVVGALLAIAGLAYLINDFLIPGIAFVIASIVGIVVVGGLVSFFTRNPA